MLTRGRQGRQRRRELQPRRDSPLWRTRQPPLPRVYSLDRDRVLLSRAPPALNLSGLVCLMGAQCAEFGFLIRVSGGGRKRRLTRPLCADLAPFPREIGRLFQYQLRLTTISDLADIHPVHPIHPTPVALRCGGESDQI